MCKVRESLMKKVMSELRLEAVIQDPVASGEAGLQAEGRAMAEP